MKKNRNININLFNILSVINLLYLFRNTALKTIGAISIIIYLSYLIYYWLNNFEQYYADDLFLWFILFNFYNIYSLFLNFNFNALYQYILQFNLLFTIIILLKVKLSTADLKKQDKTFKLILMILMIPVIYIVSLRQGRVGFLKFYHIFSPVIYKLLFPLSFFFIIKLKSKFLFLFFLIIFSGLVERTMILALLVSVLFYFIFSHYNFKRNSFILIFKGLFVLFLFLIFVYIRLQYLEIGHKINKIFMEYTGGNFFSGRNNVWEATFTSETKELIFGHGINNNFLESKGITFSAHNTFIHILINNGILGLFLFYKFLNSLWKKMYYNYKGGKYYSASIFLGTIILMNSEITLVGNSTLTGIFLIIMFTRDFNIGDEIV